MAVLPGCSTVDPPAATVNGEQISMDDFADEVRLGLPSVGFDAACTGTKVASGDCARNWMNLRVSYLAVEQMFADRGAPITDDEVTAAAANLGSGPDWATVPEPVRRRISRVAAALSRMRDADEATKNAARDWLMSADIRVASVIGTWNPDNGVLPAGVEPGLSNLAGA